MAQHSRRFIGSMLGTSTAIATHGFYNMSGFLPPLNFGLIYGREDQGTAWLDSDSFFVGIKSATEMGGAAGGGVETALAVTGWLAPDIATPTHTVNFGLVYKFE